MAGVLPAWPPPGGCCAALAVEPGQAWVKEHGAVLQAGPCYRHPDTVVGSWPPSPFPPLWEALGHTCLSAPTCNALPPPLKYLRLLAAVLGRPAHLGGGRTAVRLMAQGVRCANWQQRLGPAPGSPVQVTLYERGPLDFVEDLKFPAPPGPEWWAQHARHFYPPQRRNSSTAFRQASRHRTRSWGGTRTMLPVDGLSPCKRRPDSQTAGRPAGRAGQCCMPSPSAQPSDSSARQAPAAQAPM